MFEKKGFFEIGLIVFGNCLMFSIFKKSLWIFLKIKKKKKWDFFLFLLDFLRFFGSFSKLPMLLPKNTEFTTEHQNWLKIGTNRLKSCFCKFLILLTSGIGIFENTLRTNLWMIWSTEIAKVLPKSKGAFLTPHILHST